MTYIDIISLSLHEPYTHTYYPNKQHNSLVKTDNHRLFNTIYYTSIITYIDIISPSLYEHYKHFDLVKLTNLFIMMPT